MNTIKVFLGTSASLMALRRAVGDKIRILSMQMEQSGVRVELLCWEDYKAEFTGNSKQQEYDRDLVLQSNIIVTAFKKAIGEYTLHELQVAKGAHKKHIICYCINCKERDTIERELQDKGFSTIPVQNDMEVIDNLVDIVTDYAKVNNLMGVSQSVIGTIKNFYATIPSDMKQYRNIKWGTSPVTLR